ncbi:MAG: acyltransferase [Cyanobacteria bacterium P01_H01_bin.74]
MSQDRVAWVDLGKAIGIILVVFGHTWRGLQGAGLIENQSLYSAIDAAVYLFHMPLFFLLSGIFFEKSIKKHGVQESFIKRIYSLLFPLVIWSYISATVSYFTISLTNRSDFSVMDIILYPFPPKDIFWFLWALFLIQTAIAPLHKNSNQVIFSLIVLSSCLACFCSNINILPFIKPTIMHLPYFLMGVIFSRVKVLRDSPAMFAIGFFSFFLAELVTLLNYTDTNGALLFLSGFTATLSFCLMLYCITPRLPKTLGKTLCTLGSYSLSIYLMHIFATASVRILLVRFNIESLVLHITMATAIGLAVPLFIHFSLHKLNILHYFGLGSKPKKFNPIETAQPLKMAQVNQ